MKESIRNIIENNTCSGNEGHGIYYSWASIGRSLFRFNKCYENSNGITVHASDNNTLENNTCSNNGDGIVIHSAANNTLVNNTCTNNNADGIELYYSSTCIVVNNRCENNIFGGIFLFYSDNCILMNNTMNRNSIKIYGNLEHWNSHTIDTINTVNEKPVYYYKDVIGLAIPIGAGQLILANCSLMIIENQNCSLGSVGILVSYSSYITLMNNTCNWNSDFGIYMKSSSSCTIINNTCLSNSWMGIRFISSDNCTISKNTISESRVGLYLSSSYQDITVDENNIFSNIEYGITVADTNGNNIEATNNWWGDNSGPYHPIINSNGSGDNVTDYAIISPWIKKIGSDNDGIPDVLDAFPSDPAASKDSDGDGYPDEWNEGKSESDSTIGLILDKFPDDPDKWEDDNSRDDGAFIPGFGAAALVGVFVSILLYPRKRKVT